MTLALPNVLEEQTCSVSQMTHGHQRKSRSRESEINADLFFNCVDEQPNRAGKDSRPVRPDSVAVQTTHPAYDAVAALARCSRVRALYSAHAVFAELSRRHPGGTSGHVVPAAEVATPVA